MILKSVAITLFGLIIGSCLSICIYRIPIGKAIVDPPSYCMSCGKRLRFYDLIPVVSYLLQKGRCRYCTNRIPVKYPIVEIITAILFMVLYYRYALTIDFLAYAYLLSILVVVFFIDLEHKIIPDKLVIAGLIGGILIAVYNIFIPVSLYGDRHWWNPFLGGITGSGFLLLIVISGYIIYKSGKAMGMGDVKIFIPIGLFLGWKLTTVALIISFASAGVFSIYVIICRRNKMEDNVPFGPFIALGTLVSLVWG